MACAMQARVSLDREQDTLTMNVSTPNAMIGRCPVHAKKLVARFKKAKAKSLRFQTAVKWNAKLEGWWHERTVGFPGGLSSAIWHMPDSAAARMQWLERKLARLKA